MGFLTPLESITCSIPYKLRIAVVIDSKCNSIVLFSPYFLWVCKIFYSNLLVFTFQWRKGLKLSGETAVEKCTLDGVKGLRVMLSATVHDVLYYMSPIYCQDIINSVGHTWLLNCQYLFS